MTKTKTVTVFVGSPRKGGMTEQAARRFAEELEAFGDVRTDVVRFSDFELGMCRGCQLCLDRGEELCPLKDDRDKLIAKMLDSDGIVFASPNYSFQVPASMKVFLDRLGYLFHRPRMHGKTASAIVTQGIYGGVKVRKYLEFVSGGLGFNVVKGSVIRTLSPMTPEAIAKKDKALAEQAHRFHEQLLRPPNRVPSLFELMMFRMGRTAMQVREPETRDYQYWQGRGWFTSDYYYPVRLGVAKKAFGAFADWAVARMPAFKVAAASEVPSPR